MGRTAVTDSGNGISSKSPGDLVGARVRVKCMDGIFYEGEVAEWVPHAKEYVVRFEDGDSLETPIDEDSWDVELLAPPPAQKNRSGPGKKGKNTPENRRVTVKNETRSDSDFQPESDAEGPSVERPAARRSGGKVKAEASSTEALDDDDLPIGAGKGRKGGSAKKRKLDFKAGKGEGSGGVDGSDDFDDEQPKPRKASTAPKKARAPKAKKNSCPVPEGEETFVCEKGCGFEGGFVGVAAHEKVCGHVKPGLFEEVDEDEDEDAFLARWEASIERRVPELAAPPPGLLMELLPFQRESLSWMTQQERDSKFGGGILADEMGMGKTIQAISLIMANRGKPGNPSRGETVKTSLVVCPVVAMVQWRGEIERYCTAKSLTLYTYHGPKRSTDPVLLASYDVVLTTYSIVQSEFSAKINGAKLACKYCGKKYLPPQMVLHHKFWCGPTAQRTAAQAKQEKRKGSAPAGGGASSGKGGSKKRRRNGGSDSDSDSDFEAESEENESEDEESEDEESEEENPKKSKAKQVEKNRNTNWKKFKERFKNLDKKAYMADWHEARAEEKRLMDELSASAKSSKGAVLHSIKWHRIVLDEAHTIKDKSCQTARSVFALDSSYRWALSGTPLQNRVSELFSLIRFLQVDPYSYYYDKHGRCKSLNWDMGPDGKTCIHCGRHRINHFCWWNKHVMNPIQKFGYCGPGRTAMRRLKHEVLDRILLRRTKEGRSEDIVLPPKNIVLRKDAFDPFELDYYQSLYSQSQTQFNAYVSSGTLLNNYAHIFDLLIRLRQAVNHPYLVQFSEKNYLAAREEKAKEDSTCAICHEPAEGRVVSVCRHVFCRECVHEYMDTAPGDTVRCPTCEKPLSVDLSAAGDAQEAQMASGLRKTPGILARIGKSSDFRSSTKIEALMEELELLAEEDPCAKGIVFSQFVSMLDIIEHRLRLAGIKCVKLDGRMSFDNREKFITNFTEDPECRVFLISLKAGGVALNLTVASAVYIMDPWWNPAVEFQAMDRIHRLGQFKPIRVVRFVVQDTIEDRILRLQEKKRLVFESTVGGSNDALTRLTEADMRFLFT